MSDLYKNIKARRKELKMTQEELAMRTGYNNKSSIATIEAGKANLPANKISDFARALDTTPGHLYGWYKESDLNITDRADMAPRTGELLELYNRATPDQREAVINLLRSFVN